MESILREIRDPTIGFQKNSLTQLIDHRCLVSMMTTMQIAMHILIKLLYNLRNIVNKSGHGVTKFDPLMVWRDVKFLGIQRKSTHMYVNFM